MTRRRDAATGTPARRVVRVVELDLFDAGSDFPEPKPSADALALQHLKDVTEAP